MPTPRKPNPLVPSSANEAPLAQPGAGALLSSVALRSAAVATTPPGWVRAVPLLTRE